MRRLLADLIAVLADLIPIALLAIAAVTVVLVAGMATSIRAGSTAGLLVVNEGLVALVLGLLGWLVLVGRHRYEQRTGGQR